MGFYSRVIFPWLCDLSLDRPFVAKHRRELLSSVSGETLEIGFGTGLNLPCYPEDVRKIVDRGLRQYQFRGPKSTSSLVAV